MHKEKGNIFRATRGWKVCVVHDVAMLPRSGMYKPDVPSLCLAFVSHSCTLGHLALEKKRNS